MPTIESNLLTGNRPSRAQSGASGKRLLRKNEMCEILQISKSHLDSLIQQCRIPIVRIGRLVRFEEAEVLAAFKSSSVHGAKKSTR